MNLFFKLDIKHTLILSGLIHLFMVSPASKTLFHISLNPEPKVELPEIEFEFFQAAPREEKRFFIPQKFQEPPAVKEPALYSEPPPPIQEAVLNDDPTPSEDLPPSLEEQEAIQAVDEKTSDALQTELELKKLEESRKSAHDYSEGLSQLIQNNLQFPPKLLNQGIQDTVRVLITLNREGKLVSGTPRIEAGCASRHPEFNEEALAAIRRAAPFMTQLPERYDKEHLTITVPVRFEGKQTAPESAPESVEETVKPS